MPPRPAGPARPGRLGPAPLQVRTPLRILGVASSPRGLPLLDADKEKAHLARALELDARLGQAGQQPGSSRSRIARSRRMAAGHDGAGLRGGRQRYHAVFAACPVFRKPKYNVIACNLQAGKLREVPHASRAVLPKMWAVGQAGAAR